MKKTETRFPSKSAHPDLYPALKHTSPETDSSLGLAVLWFASIKKEAFNQLSAIQCFPRTFHHLQQERRAQVSRQQL